MTCSQTVDPLQTIFRLMSEILEARAYRGPEAWLATIGECDATAEIHRIAQISILKGRDQ